MTSAHGVEDIRIFHKECVSLAEAGYEVFLVERGETYDKKGVHIVGIGEIPDSRLKRMTRGARLVYQKALEIDADIYHLHDPELLPYGLKLKRKGKKVVFDSHELYALQIANKPYLPGWIARATAKLYEAYEKSTFKRIDGVVFPCLRDGVHPFEGMCKRIITLNNVPRIEELYDKYDPAHEKTEKSVACIGSLTYARGITNLVKAVGKEGGILQLGGTFSPPDYENDIRSMPESLCVKFLGRLNREQVVDTLQCSMIGAATSLNQGQYCALDNLATKVYEFMSMGLPVVLSSSPYNQKVVKKYRFGICVDPESVEEIAFAIRYLLDHPEEARQMGANGRRAVKEEFNWGIEEKKLFTLYENIQKAKETAGTPG